MTLDPKQRVAEEVGVALGLRPEREAEWFSTEGTVTGGWHTAVGESLGVSYQSAPSKVAHMERMFDRYGITWDPDVYSSVNAPRGGGGNIKKPAFEALLHAVRARPSLQVTADVNDEPEPLDDERILRAIRARRGQATFRSELMHAYAMLCAVTGTRAPEVLEAAHIKPFASGGRPHVTNGLLLRADIHTLFDLRLIAVDDDMRVVVSPLLKVPPYSDLAGRRIVLPEDPAKHPNRAALAEHRRLAGL